MFLVAPAVLADAPSYKYAEGGFIDASIDSPSITDFDDDGWFAGASWGWKFVHVLGEYQSIGSYKVWDAGVGFQGLLGEKADLVGRVTWQNIDIDLDPLPDFSDDGVLFSVGARWQLIKLLELNGYIKAASFDDLDDDYLYELNGIFTFRKFGVGLGWESSNEDRNTARIYFRWMFGR
jgi:hypothetical protein